MTFGLPDFESSVVLRVKPLERPRTQTLVCALVLFAGLCLPLPAAAKNDDIETAGNVLKIAVPVAGGAIALTRKDSEGALQLGVSWAGTYAISFLLQQAIKEQRPDGSGWDSFPSDSTSTAFAAASSIEARYGWNYGLPAYLAAAFVGYSRVEAEKHHWGDVAAGAVLGWAVGQIVTKRASAAPEIQAFADSSGARFNMRWNW